eukprot:TRINITY_DN29399_c0_g1_i3.p1 TRINITY_DN29399_c0_g1~~TRINITY_DN29399_c0_g1_i3.p1  ORF type:complete len:459 (+),score=130.34 TRINITY_DN29399_c0_g1_i3:78-1454(+)
MCIRDRVSFSPDRPMEHRAPERERGKCSWNEKFGIWWQDDSATDECGVCFTEFSFTRRRHHCRFCGDVVCAACTNEKSLHPKTNTMEYICATCLKELNRMIGELKLRRGLDDFEDDDQDPVFGSPEVAAEVAETAIAIATIERVRRSASVQTKKLILQWYLSAMENKYDTPPSYDETQALQQFRNRTASLSKSLKPVSELPAVDKLAGMKVGWDMLSPQEKRVLEEGNPRKMHQLLEELQRDILMSPRSERKPLKQRERILDQAVAQRLALHAQLSAESEMHAQNHANRTARMAEGADSTQLARMMVQHKQAQAEATIDMLHRLNKLAYGENLSSLGNPETMEAVVSGMAAHLSNYEVQIEGCAAVANLCACKENCKNLIGLGACRQVVAGMRALEDNEDVQVWGCRAVANLTALKDNWPRLIDAGALEAVRVATARFQNNIDLGDPAKHIVKVLETV